MQLSEDSTSSCILPFEIVEIIIDSLAEENDTDSLKAMSLVCQSVLPRCRKYLFFSINIETESTEKCLALSSPHTDIPKYIRRLEYRVYGNPLYTSHSALLERISFLQSFTLTASHWIHMDTSARSTLFKLMHLPTLTHLHLQFIPDLLVSDLFSCANLKHLQLVSVNMADKSQCTFLPPESDNFIVPRIQEYSFTCSAQTTMRLSTAKLVDGRLALDFTNLKKLSVTLSREADFEATLSLLRKYKQVEELRIRGHFDRVADIIMAFHTFGTTLSLSLVTLDFNALCDGLSGIPATNNTLRSLRLDIHDFLHGNRSHWGKLDAVLSSLRWLEDISLEILFCGDFRSIREKQESLTDLLNTQLTRLSNRTSPNFKFSAQLKQTRRRRIY